MKNKKINFLLDSTVFVAIVSMLTFIAYIILFAPI